MDENTIQEQIELEREAIRYGISQLRESTDKLANKSYASSSIYGKAFIRELLPPLTKTIEAKIGDLYKGRNGQHFKEARIHLADLDSSSAALIALKVVFDHMFSHENEKNRLTSIASGIGAAIEAECQMRFYEQTDPSLLERVKRDYWHSSSGTDQKRRVAQLMMNRKEVHWNRWPAQARVKLGGFLLNCLMETSLWFERDLRRAGKKTENYLVPSPKFLEVKDSLMANAELFAPVAWPMLIEPNDWSHDRQGGYLLNEVMRGRTLIRHQASPTSPTLAGEQPIKFLNQLQKVAYRLNPFVVEVAETLMEQRIPVGKFVPVYEIPLPPKPWDIETNEEARHSYRRAAAEVMNRNAQVVRRSCRTRKTMELVSRFKNRDRFFIPWSFDYRGRVYPIPAFLTPQDTDFGKSLLRFADEAFMTEEAEQWLAFQVATTYGLDKATLEERLDWTAANHSLISRVATDPLGSRSDWEAAEEPWQFLAACEEFHACVIACSRQFTGLPVAVDATCSGLQILAGLARDRSTAQLVNVFPGEKPQDAYLAVAEEAKTRLPERLAALLDRKVTKRTVMTIPYNAKEYTNHQHIREALEEKNVDLPFEDIQAITKAVVTSMNKIVPGPMAVMKWINIQVKEALKQGKTEVRWVTPSGFTVNQRLMKPKVEEIRLQLMGRCKLSVRIGDSDEVDKSRHQAATAPNLIHSLDASLLHLAFQSFNAPFTVIHDSTLCRSTDMKVLNARLRDSFAEMFASKRNYLQEFSSQLETDAPAPIIGDLDPKDVRKSTYFFC